MQVIAEVSIVPVGTANTGISQYVAACLEVLENRKDISYRLTPMGTIIEGPLNKILEAIREMHEVPFSKGAARVVTTIKIDDRRDKTATMNGKLESVRKLRPSTKARNG
jgi:uncharacterized protein (TIGR00106 family)